MRFWLHPSFLFPWKTKTNSSSIANEAQVMFVFNKTANSNISSEKGQTCKWSYELQEEPPCNFCLFWKTEINKDSKSLWKKKKSIKWTLYKSPSMNSCPDRLPPRENMGYWFYGKWVICGTASRKRMPPKRWSKPLPIADSWSLFFF